MKNTFAVVVLAIGSLGAALGASAADRLVPEQYSTIEQALSACVAGDVVSVAPGNYAVGRLTMPEFDVTLAGRASAAATVITGSEILVSGGPGIRRFVRLTLKNFSGYAAIQVHHASAIIESVAFDSNAAHGLFLNTSATAFTKNCTFTGNGRGGYGYVNCTWNAENCLFEDNDCLDGCYGAAAAFHVGSGGLFTNCTFVNNSSVQGGSVGLSFGGTRTFDGCLFVKTAATIGPVWWTEFGATGTCSNSTFCGFTPQDISGGFIDGGGNQFVASGCTPADCNSDNIVDLGQILRGELQDDNQNDVPDICEYTITGVIPVSGPSVGGTSVIINGTNLPESPTVLIGGVPATDVIRVSSTRITATTPAGLPGMTTVSVDNWVQPNAFYYRPECGSDLDQDGQVTAADISIVLLDFGPCYQTPLTAPAPDVPPLLEAQPLPESPRRR